jgi:molecular chaperone DnaK (HSP70)
VFGKIVNYIIPTGERPTSSYVLFTDIVRLVGEAVINQITHYPINPVFDSNNLINRKED